MPWRETFVRRFGPGLLGGITLGALWRLLSENGFRVAPAFWYRVFAIATHSSQTSSIQWLEKVRYQRRVADVQIQPPLFLLGHWRSGTTHLHNLLCIDERFGYPNNYQCLFPHAFLSWERFGSPAIGHFLPKQRPMDNITWTMQSPQEEEFALCLLSLKSPCLGWVFPQHHARYDKYLTFQDVSGSELVRWKNAFTWFLKRMTWKLQRRMTLKSPPHTARIKLLLELFPNAQFVHIHRHPMTVFSSFKRTLQINIQYHQLQHVPDVGFDDWILGQYRTMYDAFFEQRELIPAGNFHEMRFEQLEQDPIGEMRRLYIALNLPDFGQVEPAMRRYVDSIRGYQKNDYPALPDPIRQRISATWRPTFDEWGYET
jgi:hypothetical protein